jgi:hypothetical protein
VKIVTNFGKGEGANTGRAGSGQFSSRHREWYWLTGIRLTGSAMHIGLGEADWEWWRTTIKVMVWKRESLSGKSGRRLVGKSSRVWVESRLVLLVCFALEGTWEGLWKTSACWDGTGL